MAWTNISDWQNGDTITSTRLNQMLDNAAYNKANIKFRKQGQFHNAETPIAVDDTTNSGNIVLYISSATQSETTLGTETDVTTTSYRISDPNAGSTLAVFRDRDISSLAEGWYDVYVRFGSGPQLHLDPYFYVYSDTNYLSVFCEAQMYRNSVPYRMLRFRHWQVVSHYESQGWT